LRYNTNPDDRSNSAHFGDAGCSTCPGSNDGYYTCPGGDDGYYTCPGGDDDYYTCPGGDDGYYTDANARIDNNSCSVIPI
jgi:hypothetical protein